MRTEKADQRRGAGDRTRKRLLEAATELLAEHGQDNVTLRDITEAAGANIAAVSYHFGSLKALCDSAIEQALERYLAAQHDAMKLLGPASTLEELASAFAGPMVRALAVGGTELAMMRTVARAGTDPPQRWERFAENFRQIHSDALRVLKPKVPGVEESELILRTRCVAGMLNWLALSPLGGELAGQPERQIGRLLLPVLTGAFHGYSSTDI